MRRIIIPHWMEICRNSVKYDELPMSDQVTCMIEDLKNWRQNDYKEPEQKKYTFLLRYIVYGRKQRRKRNNKKVYQNRHNTG